MIFRYRYTIEKFWTKEPKTECQLFDLEPAAVRLCEVVKPLSVMRAKRSGEVFILHSRFNVVLVLFALGWHFDRVAFADDADITFQVALGAAGEVVGVAQQGPLVVELVVCGPPTLLAALRCHL